MNTYRITGTSRAVGAIGKHEPFTRTVTATMAKNAYVINYESLCAEQREHILTQKIEILVNGEFVTVDPAVYL